MDGHSHIQTTARYPHAKSQADDTALLASAFAQSPDLVLMDIRMPQLDGLAATRELAGEDSEDELVRVVVLTTFDLDEYVYEALRAGASGFLVKDLPDHELVAGVRAAARGDTMLAPSVTQRLIDTYTRRPPNPTLPAGADELTAASSRSGTWSRGGSPTRRSPRSW